LLLYTNDMVVVCNKEHGKITPGKKYTVKWVNESSYKNGEVFEVLEYYYAVLDDLGQTSLINKSYFIELYEWRENKLSELGI
jgi:hypothetical protein